MMRTKVTICPNGAVEVLREPALAGEAPADAAPTGAAADSTKSLTELGIKLVVFDMAGTTVDEGGIVYSTLKKAMRDAKLDFTEEAFNAWHGANKKEVVQHFAKAQGRESDVDAIYKAFEEELEAVYFDSNSPLKPIPGIYDYFTALRDGGIKIGLDTGFPRKIATHIIKKLGFGPYIDSFCVAMDVGAGRPFPYMIYRLMKELNIESVKQVAKMGDTVRDIEEGANAGTPYTYGCLTGADNRETLMKAGAFCVVESVVDVPVTPAATRLAGQKRPSTSASVPERASSLRNFLTGQDSPAPAGADVRTKIYEDVKRHRLSNGHSA
eukprot:TRINITY_DN14810_c0_g1_i2.p1 TRINITY_DN14810_c0_g1~~TRINITY_DN14810_c0_g1_i2.p1  ORF type:complete len:340 (+),score=153.47 TRINITY_DN14810_c0_g1_i2:48-1022(+)